ncbi:RagB/SusD family nutrient uptake outer membrane protein [Geofilum sp. OHC36d9]|uniref:RagB/SusD family nutrient uptake outer membrane protein n=1 Tax=Geofilum sp. OHC36d9 TaxID=3458413 RepID=UPI00403466D0
MNKIIYIIMTIATVLLTGCDNDFLVKENLYEVSNADYYSTPEEIEAALAATYAALPSSGNSDNALFLANLRSDDCFAGASTGDPAWHAIADFEFYTESQHEGFWTSNYKGILRANMIIKNFDNAEYSNEDDRNQALGEAYFLRALFYLRLAQAFGNVPLITNPEPANIPKASADELFGQIIYDFKTAIELMPAIKSTEISPDRLGHATKWAAQGLIARAFLFYTGKYEKADVSLPDGSTVTKNDVIAWVDDCINNSGHKLIQDFRNIWPYSYANSTYKYAIDNGLNWVGDDEGNTETIFSIKFSVYGGWSSPNKKSYCNSQPLACSMRGSYKRQDFGQGWGAGTVNPQLYESFEDGDPRKAGSILYVKDPNEGEIYESYKVQKDQMHETFMWMKKIASIKVEGTGMYDYMLGAGTQSNYQFWNMQDDIILRLADVLLMGAELGSANAQDYFDQVRLRAGLPTKPVSLEAIKTERRHELAFEGIRYYDLLRWHDEVAAFAAVKDVPVVNGGIEDTYTVTYRPETNGFLAIPESQILLSEGVLEQNPGW